MLLPLLIDLLTKGGVSCNRVQTPKTKFGAHLSNPSPSLVYGVSTRLQTWLRFDEIKINFLSIQKYKKATLNSNQVKKSSEIDFPSRHLVKHTRYHLEQSA